MIELENLTSTGQLQREPTSDQEVAGLVSAARAKLRDAKVESLSEPSRFQLAYSAAYGFALAALRKKGYRPKNRFIVFQCLAHTIKLDKTSIRVLDTCHRKRNLAEYEGLLDVEQSLLNELLRIAGELEVLVS